MLIKNNPLIEYGNFSNLYRSKTQTLPEILDNASFHVNKNVIAQTTVDDARFGIEASKFISPLEDLSQTYIFVDIGHAHLPPVAIALVSHGIDAHFMIPGHIHDRFKESLKYWADEFKAAQEKMASPVAYATLADCHRDGIEPTYELTTDQLPSANKLKELGIKKIICLTEAQAGEFYTPVFYPEEVLNWEILKMGYENQGLQLQFRGIDPRGRMGYEIPLIPFFKG